MAKSLKKRPVEETYRCRKCQVTKKSSDFFSATDDLDSNGRMSICKECCREILQANFLVEGSMEKAFLITCKKLNVCYREDLISKTRKKMEDFIQSNKPLDPLFGYYMKYLFVSSSDGEELDYKDLVTPVKIIDDHLSTSSTNKKILEREWGVGLSKDDYDYLEEEFAIWANTHRTDTKAEETLLKEIVWKQLEIRRARLTTSPTDSLIKQLQELMKTASIDPGKANAAGQGKSLENFSSFIRTIEETEPADYYKDDDLFKDYDNLAFYFEKYVTRPLKNFVMGSRDFNVDPEKEEMDEDDSFNIENIGLDDTIPLEGVLREE